MADQVRIRRFLGPLTGPVTRYPHDQLAPSTDSRRADSIDTERLFGSGLEVNESIQAVRGSELDLQLCSHHSDTDCKGKEVGYDDQILNILPDHSPEDERLVEGCSLDGNVQEQPNVRRASRPRRTRHTNRQHAGLRRCVSCQQECNGIEERVSINEPRDGDVRPITVECELCRAPKRAAKKCFQCANYICIDCLPTHERYFPLHTTIPPALEFTPDYFCNAVVRRVAACLGWFQRSCLFICCCQDPEKQNETG